MERSLIWLAAALALAMPAMAQPADKDLPKLDEATLAAVRDIGGQILTWARSDVLPQAQSWKGQLDGAMSAQDLQTLNALRARASAMRERAMKLGLSMRNAWRSEDYATLKQSRADMKKLGEERQSLMKDLKPLAEKYRSTLQAIGEVARPKVKEWGAHVKEMAQGWWQQHKGTIDPRAARAIGEMMTRGREMMGMMGPEMRAKVAAARFMLWDGTDFTRHFQEMLDSGNLGGGRRGLGLE